MDITDDVETVLGFAPSALLGRSMTELMQQEDIMMMADMAIQVRTPAARDPFQRTVLTDPRPALPCPDFR